MTIVGDRYLPPGTQVRLGAIWNDDDHVTSEYGVVVHCWMDEEINAYDCYVAFFGDKFPSGVPEDKPYVLRYAAVSLASVDQNVSINLK